MASTTKIMTALVALEKAPKDVVIISAQAATGVSSIWLERGKKDFGGAASRADAALR